MEKLEKEILVLLIFAETFASIRDEVSEKNAGIVADELKNMIVKSWVVPVKDNESESGFIFDSDNMNSFKYRITAAGIDALEKVGFKR
ncbi:MAG: hypothetical protein H7321_00305 [Bacteroidia bacterium]|nr:hypothetical protein [Bacteroidia bacterium]